MSEYEDQCESFKSLLTCAGKSTVKLDDFCAQLAEQCEILPAGTFRQFANREAQREEVIRVLHEELAKVKEIARGIVGDAQKATTRALAAEKKANDRVVVDEATFDTDEWGNIKMARTTRSKHALLMAR